MTLSTRRRTGALTPSSFYQIHSVSLTEHKSEFSRRRLCCRRFSFTGPTSMREVSSPTDRTFRICFAVAAFTLVAYWAALSLPTFPLSARRVGREPQDRE